VVLARDGDGYAELWVERPLPPGTGIRVRGTVKYEDGRPVGEFQFDLDGEDTALLVCGRDGAFDRRLPGPGLYRVWLVHADGENWEDLGLEFEVADGASVDVVLPLAKDATLLVVDRETGAPLPSARALVHRESADEWIYDDYPNPATLGGEALAADAAGRISLGPGKGTTTVFVVADGRAWRKVEVGRDGAAATRVALEPGGALRLTVAGWTALEEATVFAQCEEPWRGWSLPPPGADGRADYSGIPEGVWTVFVRRGWQWLDGEVYGEGQVRVSTGAETALTIETTPSSAGAPVPVSGTVALPAAWGRRHIRLVFEGAEPRNRTVERSSRFEALGDGTPTPFALGPMPPGEYEVTIDPQYYLRVTVQAGGGEFAFRVPPPGTLVVRVVDDATDAPVAGAGVWWHTVTDRRSITNDSASGGDAPGSFRIVAPAGRVVVSASAPGYAPDGWGTSFDPGGFVDSRVEVREGAETPVTVRLRRAGTLRVQFQWEGDSPDWGSISPYIYWKDEDGSETGWGLDVEKGVARGDEFPPGTYELRVELTEGEFDEVPPVPVRIAAGETTTVPIRLVRSR
jgi:hypothetical protein